jgi:hypothetical protein
VQPLNYVLTQKSRGIILMVKVHGATYQKRFTCLHVALAFALLALATAATVRQGGHANRGNQKKTHEESHLQLGLSQVWLTRTSMFSCCPQSPVSMEVGVSQRRIRLTMVVDVDCLRFGERATRCPLRLL